METKKSNNVNLEKRRPIFLQVGFIISLTLILMAFEWTVETTAARVFDGISIVDLDEDILNTWQKEPEKIEPPKPKTKIAPIFEIIKDDADDEEDELLFSTETDQNEWIDVSFDPNSDPEDDMVQYVICEDMPIFRPAINKTKEKGDIDLHRYVLKNASYPEIAREQGIQGRVWVKFVINKKGKVVDVAIERGVDPVLDNEALRVVRELPKFSPGLQLGKAVKVLYRVPINFKLG